MRRLMYILCIIGVLFVLGACTSQNDESEDGQKDVAETSIFKGKSEKAGSETSRHVELINVDGEKTGEATLTEEDKGVRSEERRVGKGVRRREATDMSNRRE